MKRRPLWLRLQLPPPLVPVAIAIRTPDSRAHEPSTASFIRLGSVFRSFSSPHMQAHKCTRVCSQNAAMHVHRFVVVLRPHTGVCFVTPVDLVLLVCSSGVVRSSPVHRSCGCALRLGQVARCDGQEAQAAWTPPARALVLRARTRAVRRGTACHCGHQRRQATHAQRTRLLLLRSAPHAETLWICETTAFRTDG